MTSVAVTLKAAVIDGLSGHFAALPDFNGDTAKEREVEVSYGFTFSSHATEKVYTGRTRAETPPAAMRAGKNLRNETGTFDLTILVKFIGGDALEADERADAIAVQCDDWLALRKSNQLGIEGLQTLIVDSWESDYMGVDGGTAVIRTASVRWTARLT